MPYTQTVWANGDLITSVKANNWETQYTQAYTDGIADAVIYSNVNRQTAIQGAVGTDGKADYISGSGIALTAFASASTSEPLILSFAAGNSTLGGLNYISKLTTDSTWTGLATNSTNYLYFDRSTAGVITQGFTVIAPEYGYSTIDTSNYSLLHFDGAAGSTTTTDEYLGNSWSNFGAAVLSTAQIKFGTASLTLPGSSNSYVQNTTIASLGSSSWTLEGWFYVTSTASVFRALISSVNAYGLQLYFGANITSRLYLAGSTIADTIANNSSGTINITTDTWHHWALTYNSSTYKVWFDGALDNSIPSTVLVNSVLGGLRIGMDYDSTNPGPFIGYLDEYRMSKGITRYSTAFTAPTAAFSNEIYFYNLRKNKMYNTTTEVTRLFAGAAVTDGASVTSVRPYALKGTTVITSTGLATSQVMTFNHNMGLKPNVRTCLVNLSSELGYVPGDELPIVPNYYDGVDGRRFTIATDTTTIKSITSTSALAINHKTTTTLTAITMLNWGFKFYLSRPFK